VLKSILVDERNINTRGVTAGLFFLTPAGDKVCEELLPCAPAGGAPAPPLSAPAAGVAAGGDLDDGGGDSSSSHDTDFSADQ
jgi:hypothetical protein